MSHRMRLGWTEMILWRLTTTPFRPSPALRSLQPKVDQVCKREPDADIMAAASDTVSAPTLGGGDDKVSAPPRQYTHLPPR